MAGVLSNATPPRPPSLYRQELTPFLRVSSHESSRENCKKLGCLRLPVVRRSGSGGGSKMVGPPDIKWRGRHDETTAPAQTTADKRIILSATTAG